MGNLGQALENAQTALTSYIVSRTFAYQNKEGEIAIRVKTETAEKAIIITDPLLEFVKREFWGDSQEDDATWVNLTTWAGLTMIKEEDLSLPDDGHEFKLNGEPFEQRYGALIQRFQQPDGTFIEQRGEPTTVVNVNLQCKHCGFEATGLNYTEESTENTGFLNRDLAGGRYSLGSQALEGTCRYNDPDERPWDVEQIEDMMNDAKRELATAVAAVLADGGVPSVNGQSAVINGQAINNQAISNVVTTEEK